MSVLRELWHRLKYVGRRSKFSSELSDEIDFHIESRARELQQEGFPRDEALARATREFGRATHAVEETRAAWRIQWLEDLLSDLRYAARALRRNPAFALTAIFCLALGIGANTTMFNITTNLMFSQPSCRDVASLILIREGGKEVASLDDFRYLRDARVFDDVAGIDPSSELNWREGDRTRRLSAALVTDDFFGTLGMPLRLGRGIAPGEKNTAVLAERVWRSRFESDPAILGRKLVLDGRVYNVVGILPEDDRSIVGFGFSPDIYTPIIHDDETVQLYARMPEGMTRAVARDRLRSVFAQLDRMRPPEEWKRAKNVGVYGVRELDSLSEEDVAGAYAFFAMLMILAGLVLLIACTNVASLLLARASSRSHELAVRLSLGAGRARLVRHLLAESLLLAALGTAVGVLVDLLCTRLLHGISFPGPPPVQLVFSADKRLLVYSMVVALASALIAGLVPALKSVRRDVSTVLKSESRQTGRAWGLRSVLVAGQLAISVVLLAAAFLFLHNMLRATSMNPGFDVNRTVWAYMRLVPERYADHTKRAALVRTALEQLRALPGVQAAAITEHVPMNGECQTSINLRTDLDSHFQQVKFACNNVGPSYFRTMGIPLLAGREFSPQDGPGAGHAAIVNEAFARKLFGSVNPIGRTVYWPDGPPRLIVGLVKDSHYTSFNERQKPAVYEPLFEESAPLNLQFMVRTAGPPSAYTNTITELLGRLDSTAAIETKPMSTALNLALFPSRAFAALIGGMGLLGLTLASIGLYGVLLYSVSRRTREIGLRVALGATPVQVLRIVLKHIVALVGIGMGTGLVLAALAMRPMAALLVPGVSPSEAAPFLAVLAVLGLVALIATVAPAVRALRVDPMTALRYE